MIGILHISMLAVGSLYDYGDWIRFPRDYLFPTFKYPRPKAEKQV